MPNDFDVHHREMNRFPTADEQRELDARWGIDRSLDPTEFALRFDRHTTRLADSMAGTASLRSTLLFSHVSSVLSPWILKVIAALVRRRVNHLALDATARDRFNQALQAAHADGSYQALSVIHSQNHMMPSVGSGTRGS
jgi:hypothetical protein